MLRVRYSWSFPAPTLMTLRGEQRKARNVSYALSSMNTHSWPRRGPEKCYLKSGLAWPLTQNEKQTIGRHCVANQLSIIQGQSPLCGLPPYSLWAPSSCLPFDQFPAHQSQSEGGQVEVKFRSVILYLILRRTCQRGRIVGETHIQFIWGFNLSGHCLILH